MSRDEIRDEYMRTPTSSRRYKALYTAMWGGPDRNMVTGELTHRWRNGMWERIPGA